MPNPLQSPIQQRTFIKAPPEKVYDTITSAAEWDAFFTTGMELDPSPGGMMNFAWEDWGPDFYTLIVPGKVLEADRPRRFVFEWGSKNRSVVSFDLEAKHGGTVVTCREEGYTDHPDSIRACLECASGWGEAMTLLKYYIEHGIVYSPPEKE